MAMASLKARKAPPTIDYAAPLIPSILRVESQDNACCDGASIGSHSMCAKSQSSGHVDASVKSCIARLEYTGSNPVKSQLPPLMCVCVQVPWGMVTGPDRNLYIAMDDEYEVPPLTVTGPCIAQMCRACAGRMRLQPPAGTSLGHLQQDA